MVSSGYYNHVGNDSDDDAFFTDGEGTKWVRTGDIGRVYPDGSVAIIDRKKDLVRFGPH